MQSSDNDTNPPTADISMPPKKKSRIGPILALGCGGILALLLLSIAAYYIFVPKSERDRASARRAAEAVAEQREDSVAAVAKTRADSMKSVEARHHGIMVSRDSITKLLGEHGTIFILEKGTPVDGLDNYTASTSGDSHTLLQIIGPADNPRTASISGLFDESGDANRNESRRTAEIMTVFTDAIDTDATPFIQKFVGRLKAGKDHKETKVIHGRVMTISYTNIEGIGFVTVSFDPAG